MGGKVVIGTGAAFVFGGLACIIFGYLGCLILITGLGIALLVIGLYLGLKSGI